MDDARPAAGLDRRDLLHRQHRQLAGIFCPLGQILRVNRLDARRNALLLPAISRTGMLAAAFLRQLQHEAHAVLVVLGWLRRQLAADRHQHENGALPGVNAIQPTSTFSKSAMNLMTCVISTVVVRKPVAVVDPIHAGKPPGAGVVFEDRRKVAAVSRLLYGKPNTLSICYSSPNAAIGSQRAMPVRCREFQN